MIDPSVADWHLRKRDIALRLPLGKRRVPSDSRIVVATSPRRGAKNQLGPRLRVALVAGRS